MPAKDKVVEAPDLDVAELVRDLQKTSANLKRHIADEAQKRAAELGKTYAKAADERIRDKDLELQRLADLVHELRRQMKPLERYAAGYFTLRNRAEELVKIAEEQGEPVPVVWLQLAVTAGRDAEHAEAEKQKQRAADG